MSDGPMADALHSALTKQVDDAQKFREGHAKIYYMHCRARTYSDEYRKRVPVSDGGLTLAVQRTSTTRFRYGIAVCAPDDQFNRRRGREISRGRMQTRRWSAREKFPLFGEIVCSTDVLHVPKWVWRHVLDDARDAVFEGDHGGPISYMLTDHFAETDDRLLDRPKDEVK